MKICLVSYSAEGLVSESAGGAERQVALLARTLAARGHQVLLVVTDSTADGTEVEGVVIRSGWDPNRGVRLVRAVTHRYPHLYRRLLEERGDVYYARGAGYYTPFVIQAAKAVRARSVLALASDRDLYPSSGRVLFGVRSPLVSAAIGPVAHRAFTRLALRRADWVAVQNKEQAESCSRLGLRHAVLPNIVESPSREASLISPERDVLWAGNVVAGRRSKGLEELAALVLMLPDVTFTVAGRLSSQAHAETIALLGQAPNVELVGRLSHQETQRCIASHRLVVNTSPSEGFSNVMLEGWALRRPAVTLSVNPSGLLTGDDLGIVARGDLGSMAAAIVALLAEPDARELMGRRGCAYVRANHAPEHVAAAFEELVSG